MKISASEQKSHQVSTLQRGGVHQSCNSYQCKSITNKALQAGIGLNLIIANHIKGRGGEGGGSTFIEATCESEHLEEHSTYIVT